MWESMLRVSEMEKVNSHTKMEISMKDPGRMIRDMEWASILSLVERSRTEDSIRETSRNGSSD